MQRSEFDQYFNDYRKYLREEVHRFHDHITVYRQVQELKYDQLETMNLAPAFFRVTEDALFTSIVLWADKLFDEKGERGFFNFLTLIENNRKWLSVSELQRRRTYPDDHWMLEGRTPITISTIEKDRQKIRDLEALESFRLRRDKFHGHFDKKYFFDRSRLGAEAPIRWFDLNEAGKVMGNIINDYSTDFDGVSYSWETLNIGDLEVLLDHVNRGP
jgi:hypothetical protein